MIACFFRSAKKKLTPQPVDLPYPAPETLLASPLTGTVPVPVTPVSAATPSSSHQLTPQQLHFGTPSEQSPGSSNSSQPTPQMESMKQVVEPEPSQATQSKRGKYLNYFLFYIQVFKLPC